MKKILFTAFFVTAIVAGKNANLALEGYCPVAYVEMNTALIRSHDYMSQAGGVTYLFANADAKKMFDANPIKYTGAIQYSAYCATAMSMGKKLKSDMAIFSKHEINYTFSLPYMPRQYLTKTPTHLWIKLT